MKALLLKSIVTVLVFSSAIQAAPAYSGEIVFRQKDGSTFSGYLKGDEYFHWIEDKNGRIILYNKEDKMYEFAKIIETTNGMFDLNLSGIKVTFDGAMAPALSELPKIDHQLLKTIWQNKRAKASKHEEKLY